MPDINKFRVLVHGCSSLAYGKAEGSALAGLSLLVDLPPWGEQVVSGYLGLCLCGVLLMLRKAEGSALAGLSLLVYLPRGRSGRRRRRFGSYEFAQSSCVDANCRRKVARWQGCRSWWTCPRGRSVRRQRPLPSGWAARWGRDHALLSPLKSFSAGRRSFAFPLWIAVRSRALRTASGRFWSVGHMMHIGQLDCTADTTPQQSL